jgi:hypothetical protein
MKPIQLSLENEKRLKNSTDVDSFVNSLISAYFKGSFIHKSKIAGSVTVDKVYKKGYGLGIHTFDVVTNEFEGVTIIGAKTSRSIFIPNIKLAELLENHQTILVLKSPRPPGIRVEETGEIFIPASPEEMS